MQRFLIQSFLAALAFLGIAFVARGADTAETITPIGQDANGVQTVAGPGDTVQADNFNGSTTVQQGGVQVLSVVTAPLSKSGATVSIPQGTGAQDGFLDSADWTLFDSKVDLGDLSATAPLSYNSGTGAFSIPAATSGQNGYLTSADWSTFNAKEPAISAGTSAQYWRGDKTFQTLNTAAVPESGSLYYTDARARAALSATSPATYNNSTGAIGWSGTTSDVPEGSNQYHTTARARGAISAAAPVTYNSTTGEIGVTGLSGTNTGDQTISRAGDDITLSASGGTVDISDKAELTDISATSPVAYDNGTGVISLETSGVAAGSYTYSNITVDATGRVTSASNGATPLTAVPDPIVPADGTQNVTGALTASGLLKGSNFRADGFSVMAPASAGGTATDGRVVIALGFNAGAALTATDGGGVFIGSRAGQSTTTGSGLYLGNFAGQNRTVASGNIAVGTSAFFGDVSTANAGSNNIAIGVEAGYLMNGANNIAIGLQSGYQVTNSNGYNVMIGQQAGYTAGDMQQGVFIGWRAGYDATTGIANVGIGENSLGALTTGYDNVGIGSDAFCSDATNTKGLTTGFNNVAVGNNAGGVLVGGVGGTATDLTGQANTAIGANAFFTLDGQYMTSVGSGAFTDKSNQLVLGRPEDEVKIPGTFVLEGATENANETTLAVTDPTADRTITLPDATGTVVLREGAETISGDKTFTGALTFSSATLQGASPLVFEGATADANETTLAVTDPTADRTITLPNVTGTVVLREGAETITGAKKFTATPEMEITGTTAFIEFDGTLDVPASGNVTSDTGGGANVVGPREPEPGISGGYAPALMIRVKVNGTDYWMPLYSYVAP